MSAATIGIDIGTQGTKAGIFTARGVCLAQAFQASKLHRPRAGVVEEDPERQLSSVCACIRECMKTADIAVEDIKAIAIDGQMAGVIGVDADGKACTPYDSWLDTRCAPFIETMTRKAGDEIIRSTGGPASYNHGPKMLWWQKERKDDFKRIRAFVQPGGYVAMRLCGLRGDEAFIDHSYLHFSGFADTARGHWNEKLCESFRFDAKRLPRIVAPQDIIGTVSGAMARRCALAAGTPVVAGCGDTAASFLACGAVEAGICIDVAGTASVFAATTASKVADTKHRTLGCGRAIAPGLWHPYAYINGGGMNLEWFRSQICDDKVDFKQLDREAMNLELGDSDPYFVPHLAGRVSPSMPALRGGWIGLRWEHSRARLYRAVLESVGLEYAIYRDVLLDRRNKPPIKQLRITGGGEKSPVWNQIKADVLGIPVTQMLREEGAPLGAALLAAWAIGLQPSLKAGSKQWCNTKAVNKPVRKNTDHYSRRVDTYRRLLDSLNAWSAS